MQVIIGLEKRNGLCNLRLSTREVGVVCRRPLAEGEEDVYCPVSLEAERGTGGTVS